MPFSPVGEVIEDIRAGKMVIVCDDEDRENEGDLTMAAELVTADDINFMASHGRGLICLPMAGEIIDQLGLPRIDQHNAPRMDTAFTASIDAATGITSGVSAADRARTIRVAADAQSGPEDLVMPGHVFPLRARPGGVLRRPGQTEAAVDLARLAGLRPAGAICEVMKGDGTMARVPDLEKFSEEHRIRMVTVAQIIEYRHRYDEYVRCTGETRLPTKFGMFRLKTYVSESDDVPHLALLAGEPEAKDDALVYVHVECLQGDVFRSPLCDCAARLEAAMSRVQQEGEGIVVYTRLHVPRSELIDRLQTASQHEPDPNAVEKSLRVGAQIAKDLGIGHADLVTETTASAQPRRVDVLM